MAINRVLIPCLSQIRMRNSHIPNPRKPCSKLIMSIKFGYLNVHGLTTDKLQACASLLDSGLFDILLLSETWYVKTHDYMGHPYCIGETRPSEKKSNTRQGGGLLLMCKDASFVRSFKPFKHSISVSLRGGPNILGVYFPPSLSMTDVEAELEHARPYDSVIGDINIRFTGISRSKAKSSCDRQSFWTRWSRENGFSMIPPNRKGIPVTQRQRDVFALSEAQISPPIVGKSYSLHSNYELDHVFCRDAPEVHLLDVNQFNIKTDHG